MKDADCPLDCWVFLRTEKDGQYPSEPIRQVLYRFIMQGIRRSQCHGFPLSVVGGLAPKGRLFFNGSPTWQRDDGKVDTVHPLGYRRAVDENSGTLLWVSEDGEFVIDGNGGRISDSLPLWWPESSSSEGDVEIYDAD